MLEPGEERSRWEEAEDRQIPSDEAFNHLLNQLTKLEELEIEGSSRLALKVIPVDPEEVTRFPFRKTLKALDLTSTFPSLRDPFLHLSHLWLHEYDRLTSFSYDVRRSPDAMPLPYPDPNNEYHRLEREFEASIVDPSRLRDLSLTGPFAASSGPREFLKRCTSLESLALNDTHVHCILGYLLGGVPHPERIRHLQLWLSDDDAVGHEDQILEQLPRFTSLKTILVQGPWVPLDLDFYSILSHLPLERISIKLETEVSLDQLVRLVSGPEKMSTLKRITLDNVDAVRGDALPRDQGDEAVRDADLIGLGWNLADWSETFTREGLKRFLEVAKEENVAVDGYAVAALDIEDAWEVEMEYYRSIVPR